MAYSGLKNQIGGQAGIDTNGLVLASVLPIDGSSIDTVNQTSVNLILNQVGSSVAASNPMGATTFTLNATGLSYSAVIDNVTATLSLYQNNNNASPILLQSGIAITDGVTPSSNPFQIVAQVIGAGEAIISVTDSSTELVYSFQCNGSTITSPGTSVNIGIGALGLSAANISGGFFIFASGAGSSSIFQLECLGNSYTLYDTINIGTDIVIDCNIYQQSDGHYYLAALSTAVPTGSTITQYIWNALNFVNPITAPITPVTLQGTIEAVTSPDDTTYLGIIIPESNFIAFFEAAGATLNPITAFDLTPYGTLPSQKALYPIYALNGNIYANLPLIDNSNNLSLISIYFNGTLCSDVGNSISIGSVPPNSVYNIVPYEISSEQFLFVTNQNNQLVMTYQTAAAVIPVLQALGVVPFYNAIPYSIRANNGQEYEGQIDTSISSLAPLTAQQVTLTWGKPFTNGVIGLPSIEFMETTSGIAITIKPISVTPANCVVEIKNLDAVTATGNITITAEAIGF